MPIQGSTFIQISGQIPVVPAVIATECDTTFSLIRSGAPDRYAHRFSSCAGKTDFSSCCPGLQIEQFLRQQDFTTIGEGTATPPCDSSLNCGIDRGHGRSPPYGPYPTHKADVAIYIPVHHVSSVTIGIVCR